MGRRSAALASSKKKTSVRYAIKHQSQLLTTSASSTNRTSARSTNKQYIQILFISTSKASTKHTVYYMTCRKRQITTHDDDGGDVDGGASAGWGTARIQHNRRPKRSRRRFVVALFASSLFSGMFLRKFIILNLVNTQSFSC